MSLKRCRECGNPVSSSARKCPHCGKRNPTTSPVSYFVIVIIAIVFGLIISSMGGGSRTSSRFPKTYNDAYREYQNGNKAPLEGFYNWLEKNP